jgi:uncharacterized protein YkwD
MNSRRKIKILAGSTLAGAFSLLFFMTGGLNAAAANNRPVDSITMTAAHNQWRSKIGVPDLKWSDELAASSWQWADQVAQGGCNIRHSTTVHGENIYFAGAAYNSDGTSFTQKVSAQDVVDAWGKEMNNYDYESNSCHGVCGHYTQVVWQSTAAVGCGMAVCNDKTQIWVCQYYPRGNMIGQRPYSRKTEGDAKVSLFKHRGKSDQLGTYRAERVRKPMNASN